MTPVVGLIYMPHEFLNMPKQTCERCGAQNVPCIGQVCTKLASGSRFVPLSRQLRRGRQSVRVAQEVLKMPRL